MKAKEFSTWRDRVNFAKRVWDAQGLLGTDQDSTMRLLISMYRGGESAHMGRGMDTEFANIVNKVFPVANTLMGQVASRNPKVQVFPRSRDSVKSALPVEHLVNYDIEEMDFKRQTNQALLHNLFAPMGFLQHGFTPSREFESESGRRLNLYRPAKPDKPFMRARPIWDVLMDPTQRSFHVDEGMEWVAFRDLMWLQDIKDNPNMKNREGLDKLKGNITPEWDRMRHFGTQRAIRIENDPDQNEMVEVFTVYEARERTWFQMTLSGLDKPLREREDWPIPWETLPVSILQVNEQMDTPFSLPIMDVVAPIQVELNRLRTMMGQLVFRLRRIVAVANGQMEKSELTKIETAAMNEIILTKGNPEEAIKMISSGVFPPELLQYNALLEEDMREGIGQGKMSRAQRINVDTATEAANVQRGDDVATSRIVEAFQNFNQDAIRLYMQGRRATMDITGDEIVRIVGQQDVDGVQEWAEISPEVLHGDYEFKVIHGSTLPEDRDRDAQKASLDLQVAAGMPDQFNVAFFVRRYLEARGIEPTRGMVKDALTNSAVRSLDQVRRNAQPGGEDAAGGGGFDANVAALAGQQQGGVQ